MDAKLKSVTRSLNLKGGRCKGTLIFILREERTCLNSPKNKPVLLLLNPYLSMSLYPTVVSDKNPDIFVTKFWCFRTQPGRTTDWITDFNNR